MKKKERKIIRTIDGEGAYTGLGSTPYKDYEKKQKEKKKRHPDDCDCIKCLARTEKGGLDYDPSNDDEEFEEHERQVFRDVGITEKEDK